MPPFARAANRAAYARDTTRPSFLEPLDGYTDAPAGGCDARRSTKAVRMSVSVMTPTNGINGGGRRLFAASLPFLSSCLLRLSLLRHATRNTQQGGAASIRWGRLCSRMLGLIFSKFVKNILPRSNLDFNFSHTDLKVGHFASHYSMCFGVHTCCSLSCSVS